MRKLAIFRSHRLGERFIHVRELRLVTISFDNGALEMCSSIRILQQHSIGSRLVMGRLYSLWGSCLGRRRVIGLIISGEGGFGHSGVPSVFSGLLAFASEESLYFLSTGSLFLRGFSASGFGHRLPARFTKFYGLFYSLA